MQSTEWPPEHCAALREFLKLGMSFSAIAAALNAKFKTAYSRNAVIGRARRTALAGSQQPNDLSRPAPRAKARLPYLARKPVSPEPRPRMPVFEGAEKTKLRCVAIDPRHLSLLELERGDCRYPYGGDADGEAITFCGHPRHQRSSYCMAHFHLTRGPGTRSERTASTVALRLVEAA